MASGHPDALEGERSGKACQAPGRVHFALLDLFPRIFCYRSPKREPDRHRGGSRALQDSWAFLHG